MYIIIITVPKIIAAFFITFTGDDDHYDPPPTPPSKSILEFVNAYIVNTIERNTLNHQFMLFDHKRPQGRIYII